MTVFQTLTLMIAGCSLVVAIIFGLLTVCIGMLNLIKKK